MTGPLSMAANRPMTRFGIALLLACVLRLTPALAHSLLFVVNDNGDGTVTVEGSFSTGGHIAHAEVRLEDDAGEVLWRGETDAEGKATFKKPEGAYVIVLDGGKGHRVEREGPQ